MPNDQPAPSMQQEPLPARPNLAVGALRYLAVLAVLGTALFGAAGSIRWPMAWAYLALSAVLMTITLVVLTRHDPALLAERSRVGPGTKWWDKLIAPLVGIVLPIATLVIAGLDRRFGWSPALPIVVQIVALAGLVPGYGLIFWALFANTFFATTVRIQTERGHRVVTTGPYRFVRHPGYVGAILANLALPVALGSLWALVSGAAIMVVLVIRTALEDATLVRELAGYEDYRARTRWRLLPGVW